MKNFTAPKQPLKCVLCVDNDNAADNFRQALTNERISFIDVRPPNKYKDFNEQLIDLRSQVTEWQQYPIYFFCC